MGGKGKKVTSNVCRTKKSSPQNQPYQTKRLRIHSKNAGFLQNPHFQSYTPLPTHRVSLRWRAWRAQAVRVWLNQIDTALRSVAATSLADWWNSVGAFTSLEERLIVLNNLPMSTEAPRVVTNWTLIEYCSSGNKIIWGAQVSVNMSQPINKTTPWVLGITYSCYNWLKKPELHACHERSASSAPVCCYGKNWTFFHLYLSASTFHMASLLW